MNFISKISLRHLLLFAFIPVFGTAQAEENMVDRNKRACDSLKQVIYTQPHTEKQQLDLYYHLIGTYATFDADSVLAYIPEGIRLAKKLKAKEIEMTLYCHWGVALCFRGEHEKGFVCFDRMKELAIETGNRREAIQTIAYKAFSCALQGKYYTAIDYYLKNLKICEAEGWKDDCIRALGNLGELHRKLGNTQMAIRYLDRSAELCEPFKTTDSFFYAWRITQVYDEYATVYLEQGLLDKALEYALKANDTYDGGGVINICHTQRMLAKIYLRMNDYDRALNHAAQAMKQAEILQDKTLFVNTRIVLSDIYLMQKRYREAEAEAETAWQADSTNIDESRLIARNIAQANIFLNNPEKADYFLRKYAELNEQYSKKSFHNAVSDLSIRYETEEKVMRISNLEQQKVFYLIVGITGLLLSVAVWLIFRQKMRREQIEKQLIATNAVFEGEKRGRELLARDLHDGVNGMLSAIRIGLAATDQLQNIREQIDNCIEEIRFLAGGVMPRSLQLYGMKAAIEDHCRLFPDVHFYFFGDNKRIDSKVELVVYYCAYELIHNSVKHSGASQINVQLIQEEKRISLSVQDNGCGFDPKSAKQGVGLKSLHDRVAAFNGRLDIATSPGNGTETTIELKITNP